MFPLLRITFARSLPFFCTAFLITVSIAQDSTQILLDEAQDLIQRQMRWDANQPGKLNPAGLSFQFFKTDERTSSDKQLVSYRAYVLGAPESKKYSLTVWKLGSEPHILSGAVYVNAKGLLMTHKPRPEEENSDFAGGSELELVAQAARGEPIRFALSSADKEIFVRGTVVPFPLKDTDGSCVLEARLAMPDAGAVLISADGLPPNTEVPVQISVAGEPEMRKFDVNANGHAVMPVVPFIAGKDHGSLKVALTTKDCSTAVELPWGKGSYKPF